MSYATSLFSKIKNLFSGMPSQPSNPEQKKTYRVEGNKYFYKNWEELTQIYLDLCPIARYSLTLTGKISENNTCSVGSEYNRNYYISGNASFTCDTDRNSVCNLLSIAHQDGRNKKMNHQNPEMFGGFESCLIITS